MRGPIGLISARGIFTQFEVFRRLWQFYSLACFRPSFPALVTFGRDRNGRPHGKTEGTCYSYEVGGSPFRPECRGRQPAAVAVASRRD